MSIAIPIFKGIPSNPASAEYVDYRLWRAGIKRHLHENRPNGDERSYLRGIHNYSSLGTLNTFLRTNIPNAVFRLQSVWVDKHPQAHFNTGKNCELGDLLLIARIRMVSGLSTKSHVVGWLLQGKTAADPARVQHTDGSTINEVDLYSNHLLFDVKHFSRNLGTFDLAKDQDIVTGAAYRKWEFLQFCLDDTEYGKSSWPLSPIQRLWPLGAPHTQCGLHSSFAEAVLKIAQSSSFAPSDHGAVLERNPEWSRLCNKLLEFTAARSSRLARGSWQRVFPYQALKPWWVSRFELNPSFMPLFFPPYDEDKVVLTSHLTHSFHSNGAAHAFLSDVTKAEVSQARSSSHHDRDREPPDDLRGNDDGEEGGISTLVIDVTRNDE